MRTITIVAMLTCIAFAMPMQARHTQTVLPVSWPETFFTGRTAGSGTIKVMMSPRSDVAVVGTGRMDADGTLDLAQVINRTGKAPKKREWQLKAITPGHYVGSLTDAVGGVAGDVQGNDFHVRFRIKSGIDVDQHLILLGDRATISNRMTFTKLGIVVGRMRETIRRSTPLS